MVYATAAATEPAITPYLIARAWRIRASASSERAGYRQRDGCADDRDEVSGKCGTQIRAKLTEERR